jgi:hypothetical protein
MRLTLLIVVAAATISCGGKQHGGGTTTASGDGSAGGSAPDGSGSGGGSAAMTPPKPLTKDECGAMIGHIFDIGISEKKKTWKPAEVPTDEQLAAARVKQIEQGTDPCLQMQVPRPMFDCAMNATDAAALEKCQEAGGAGAASGTAR